MTERIFTITPKLSQGCSQIPWANLLKSPIWKQPRRRGSRTFTLEKGVRSLTRPMDPHGVANGAGEWKSCRRLRA